MFNITKWYHWVGIFFNRKVFLLFIEKILQRPRKIFKFAPTAFNSCIHTNDVWTAYLPAEVSIP